MNMKRQVSISIKNAILSMAMLALAMMFLGMSVARADGDVEQSGLIQAELNAGDLMAARELDARNAELDALAVYEQADFDFMGGDAEVEK